MKVWYCDPQKHHKCRKSACYLFGGPCHLTIHEENAIVLDGKKMEGPEWNNGFEEGKANDS